MRPAPAPGATKLRRAGLVGLVVVLLPGAPLGCAATAPREPDGRPSPPPTTTDHVACAAAKDPLHPLIVEWPATSRAELETSAADGPVVVSYGGCVLKVLSSCRAGGAGAYELQATTPSEDRLEIEDAHQLHADLPLGVASLKGKLEEGTRLSLAYVTVGARMLRKPPAVLQGDCDGATHYVGLLMLGAFSLVSSRAFAGAAAARIAGASADGAATSRSQISGSSGDLSTCKARGLAAGAACQAVLGVWLRPLQLVAGKPASAGFGLGLTPPAKVPDVPEVRQGRDLPALSLAATGGDFARLDLTLLELVQAAIVADRASSVASAAKAQAWDRVARHRAPNRYAESAVHRRDEWRRRLEAERARSAQLAGLCPQYRADRDKLTRLLRLGGDVIRDQDKAAYEKELADAYAPWPEVEHCPALSAAAADEAAWPALHGANDGMVPVRGGTFEMGSYQAGGHARPIDLVTVADFEIDATEVTVEAYARCQRAGACSQRASDSGDDTWRCNDTHRLTAYGPSGGERTEEAPANCMDFGQAQAFCRWAGKRLPTEEEWEYAARGTDGRRYPWGEWAKEDGHPVFSLHYCASSTGYRVGSFATNASPFGARDMAGSVWEWTTGHFSDGYDNLPTTPDRVLRGGLFSWSNEVDCQPYDATYRLKHPPHYADSNLGVRCARGGAR